MHRVLGMLHVSLGSTECVVGLHGFDWGTILPARKAGEQEDNGKKNFHLAPRYKTEGGRCDRHTRPLHAGRMLVLLFDKVTTKPTRTPQ
jgi:hypothetical protein